MKMQGIIMEVCLTRNYFFFSARLGVIRPYGCRDYVTVYASNRRTFWLSWLRTCVPFRLKLAVRSSLLVVLISPII